jgi:FkbM family methyltransferase
VRLPWGAWWLAWNDVMGRHALFRDGFEAGEQNLLLRLVAPGMTALDLGAHHGLYTLLLSKNVGPGGRVIAFEPSPRERTKLRWHIQINRCANVRVEPLAIGDAEGITPLYVCLGKETGCNSLRLPAVSEKTKTFPVSVVTLDDYLQRSNINRVDFVKLDVEGAELAAMKGASGLLTGTHRPILMYELADVRTKPWHYRGVEAFDLLAARHYRQFSITPEGRLRHCPRKEHFHENLLAVPDEKLGFVSTLVQAGGD